MYGSRRVFLLETDPEATAQMRRVLDSLAAVTTHAADEDSAFEIASGLFRENRPPDLIIVRVTLAGSSGIETLARLAEFFPKAKHIVTSHYSKELLFRVPGFAEYAGDFLPETFTDDQFRQAVEVRLGPKAVGWVDRA